ncbi:MAG TPA: hypothetical protein VH373_12800 [Jatrophihabitantaceae bacterium]|jgi:hypothetical protein
MIFHRRERLPAELVALLDQDERVVAWGRSDEAVVAASNRGLWVPDGGTFRRIGWELVDKAVWRDGVLTVIEAELVDDLLLRDRPPIYLPLTEPRDLPPTVRRRVEASVVRSEVLPISGGAARFVARRVPGRDGVNWWARLEPGTRDSATTRASVRARCDQLMAGWQADQPR